VLKRDITYENLDGESVTETFYFNLTRTEVVELQVSYKEGLGEYLQRIVRTNDQGQVVAMIKMLILTSYGVRSDDGKHFLKSKELSEQFVSSFAYDSLFTELTSNETAAVLFLQGIMPKAVREEIEKAQGQVPVLPTAKE
jgi:hypothetical protein